MDKFGHLGLNDKSMSQRGYKKKYSFWTSAPSRLSELSSPSSSHPRAAHRRTDEERHFAPFSTSDEFSVEMSWMM